jgi:hypothetical protein
MSLRKGKRPWIFCFNPQCPSRQQGATEPSQDQDSLEQPDNKEDNSSEEENPKEMNSEDV